MGCLNGCAMTEKLSPAGEAILDKIRYLNKHDLTWSMFSAAELRDLERQGILYDMPNLRWAYFPAEEKAP